MSALAEGLPTRFRAASPRQRRRDRKRAQAHAAQVARICVPPPPHHWKSFGRSVVVPPARVENPDCIEIGDGVIVLENVWMSVVRMPDMPPPRLVVGDHARIGRGCQLSIARSLVIEGGAIVGDFVQIGDTSHPYDVYEERMTEVLPPEPVHIERGAVIGSHSVLLPGVRIGAGAYVDHHSVVTADVAPGAVVAGNPARPVVPAS